MKIGYFGSISLSKGISTLIKLSKIDLENDYFIYGGNKEAISKMRMIMNTPEKHKKQNTGVRNKETEKIITRRSPRLIEKIKDDIVVALRIGRIETKKS